MSKQNLLRYETFIVQFWEEPSQQVQDTIWRFTLEDPRTGKRQGYTDFKSLIEALRAKVQPGEENCD